MLSKSSDKKLIEEIYLEFPFFKDYIEQYIFEGLWDSPYALFDALGTFVCDAILKENERHGEILNKDFSNEWDDGKKVFIFINKLCERNFDDINDLLSVTFFEKLTDYQITIQKSKNLLKGKAREIFTNVLNSPMFQGGKSAK